MKTIYAAFCIALLLTGCVTRSVDPHQQTISNLSPHVYRLSAAADVLVDSLPEDARDEQILSAVAAKDPSLTKPFDGYTVKAYIAKYNGNATTALRTAVILVCSEDKRNAFIEDVSCTGAIDTVRPTGSPCKHYLDPLLVCQ